MGTALSKYGQDVAWPTSQCLEVEGQMAQYEAQSSDLSHYKHSNVRGFSGSSYSLLVSASLEFAALWLSISRTYSAPHPTKKLVGVMLGSCTAQKAVQWSLLTYKHSGLCSGSLNRQRRAENKKARSTAEPMLTGEGPMPLRRTAD